MSWKLAHKYLTMHQILAFYLKTVPESTECQSWKVLVNGLKIGTQISYNAPNFYLITWKRFLITSIYIFCMTVIFFMIIFFFFIRLKSKNKYIIIKWTDEIIKFQLINTYLLASLSWKFSIEKGWNSPEIFGFD